MEKKVMPPDKIEGLPPGSVGPQGTAIALARDCNISLQQDRVAAQEPVDRRTSTSGLSVSVRDVRIRLARNDIYDALCPVSRHAEAALLCLELEDDAGLEHHLGRIVGDVRKAAQKHKELRALLAAPARETAQ
jgi:hypothetical protein